MTSDLVGRTSTGVGRALADRSPGPVDASSRASRPASVTIAGRPFPIRPHNCFACGSTNVAGLGLALHVEGDTCWTELELPDRFEGWQGIAHGGIVATILDEVMAWSLVDRDAWGLTARMSVDFKRPVPIGRRIRGEGRLVDRRRRLLRTSARLVDVATGDLLATAEGTYLAAPDERKRILKRTYGFDAEDVPAPASTGPATAAIEGPE